MPRRNSRELETKMTPKQIAERDAHVKKILEEMPLNRLRRARQMTQEHLAAILKKDQSAISQMERRTDIYVRTLADFIRAMGGELEIRANFADGSVRITGLAGQAEKTESLR
jgi:ribosome-binding protein aMBF1 (putative translation factor)